MAKDTGFPMTVSVDDSGGALRDISNDITNISFGTPQNQQDITGLDKSGIERLGLLKDGQVTLNGVFNDDTNKSHDVLKDFDTIFAGEVGRTVTIAISGQTLSMEMLFTDYALTRGTDGSLVWTASCQLSDGTSPSWS